MAAGIIQLVATGIEETILIDDPEITFFKIVYRRHTNFSTETVKQQFDCDADFGKRVSCTISKNADLISNMYLIVDLPLVPKFYDKDGNEDNIARFAWARKVGLALIEEIEVEIGGQLIDRQYGDWMNIWYQLVRQKDGAYQNMIGDIKLLYQYDKQKPAYRLRIPLSFWFCRSSGLVLPIVSLQFTDVKVNVSFNELSYCSSIGPTHYIQLNNDLVNFTLGEYLTQEVSNGSTAQGVYIGFDLITQKLYYNRISDTKFQALTGTLTSSTDQQAVLDDTSSSIYEITGNISKFKAMPEYNAVESRRKTRAPKLSMVDAFLLVDFIYIDESERKQFLQADLEYLIEQVQYDGEYEVRSNFHREKIQLEHPTKELFWVGQENIMHHKSLNDHFNYTDSIIRDVNGNLMGDSLVIESSIEFNDIERIKPKKTSFYNELIPYYYHEYQPEKGISCYPLCLYPENVAPSGSCNMSKIDRISIPVRMNKKINYTNPATMRAYGLSMNVLRISNGLSGLVFVKAVGL